MRPCWLGMAKACLCYKNILIAIQGAYVIILDIKQNEKQTSTE